MIALLCSVQAEADITMSRFSDVQTSFIGSKSITEGAVSGQRAALCVCGMGKVNASHAATLLILRYDPEVIINFGIGGAYPSSGAQVGDIVLAEEEVAGDEGVLTLDGFKDTEYIGIPLLKTATSVIYTTYTAPAGPLDRARQALLSFRQSGKTYSGRFITLSTCTGTNARARELEEKYHGLCENMEGAAVAQVAALHTIPWLEVRGISNIVEDRDLKKWDVPRAAHAAQQALLHILKAWEP